MLIYIKTKLPPIEDGTAIKVFSVSLQSLGICLWHFLSLRKKYVVPTLRTNIDII